MAKTDLTATQIENRKMGEAVAGMSGDLRSIYDVCYKLYSELTGNDIVLRYEIGQHVAAVLEEPDKYGTDAAGLLATSLGEPVSWIYSCRRVAGAWSLEEIGAITGKEGPGGKRLTWSHLDAIVKENLSRRDRQSLLSECIKKGLSVRDVNGLVLDLIGKSGNNQAGRQTTYVAPRSPSSALQQMHKATMAIVDRQKTWGSSLFDKVEQQPGDYASADFLNELAEAVEEQSVLEAMAAQNKRKLQVVLATIREVVERGQVTAGTPASKRIPAVKRTPVDGKKRKKGDGRDRRKQARAGEDVAAGNRKTKKTKKTKRPFAEVVDAAKTIRTRKRKKAREPVTAA